jgi:hypothetical protein
MEYFGPTAGIVLVLATTIAMLLLETVRRVLIRRMPSGEPRLATVR